MSAFTNVLAGVEFSWPRREAVPVLDAVAAEVARCATWLARRTGARVTFLSALDGSAGAVRPPAEGGGTPGGAAREALDRLVREAGDRARGELIFGPGQAELLRRVREGAHDLLLVGTHERHGFRRALFGSTAAHLIQGCPCPVWVSKPRPEDGAGVRQILVAWDPGPAARHALGVALALAADFGARVHVLHALDYPVDHIWATGLRDRATVAYHARVREQAESTIRRQLGQDGGAAGGPEVQVHFTDLAGLPDEAIVDFVGGHAIDLLVLGMAGHSGIAGLFVGDTAVRVLPEVPCSVLAVRPAGGTVPG
jgi:universal stress protein E